MLVDKMDQEIKVGMYVIKPWNGEFDLGRVTKVTDKTFTYEYKGTGFYKGKTMTSVCKIPWHCLVVPEILANYWSVLEGV